VQCERGTQPSCIFQSFHGGKKRQPCERFARVVGRRRTRFIINCIVAPPMVRESKAPVPSTPNHLSRRLLHCPSSAAHDVNQRRSCVFDCEYDKENIQNNETHGGRRVSLYKHASAASLRHCSVAACAHTSAASCVAFCGCRIAFVFFEILKEVLGHALVQHAVIQVVSCVLHNCGQLQEPFGANKCVRPS